jgi:hypothetical protein
MENFLYSVQQREKGCLIVAEGGIYAINAERGERERLGKMTIGRYGKWED